jgi:hypothetical protein
MATSFNPNQPSKKELEGRCRTDLGECAEEVGRECWKAFLDDFSQVYAQVPVSVEIRDISGGGDHFLAHCAPLMGVSIGEHEAETIDVILGDEKSEVIATHIIPVATRHQIATASRVWRQRDPQGREMLQITDVDGVSTVITVLGSPSEQCPST